MRVALLGASGFVGSAILTYLHSNHPDVEVLDLSRPEFDITAKSLAIPANPRVDLLINAVGAIDTHVEDLLLVNGFGASRVAAWARQHETRLVHLSTGAVLGGSTEIASANSKPTPSSDYGVSKHLGEVGVRHLAPDLYTIIRLFYPYGRGQRLPRLLPRLVEAIRSGSSIFTDEDGGPVLNLGHVDDVARFLVEDFVVGGKHTDPVVHLASDQLLTVREVAEGISDQIGLPAIIEVRPKPSCPHSPVSEPYRPTEWRPFDVASLLG